jgi:hypothetical protein
MSRHLKYRIVKIEDGRQGQAWTPGGKTMVLGRSTPEFLPDIAVDDPKVSRRHLEFVLEEGVLRVMNISGSEARVNDQKLQAEKVLREGDVLRIFSHCFEVTAMEEKSAGGRKGKTAAVALACCGVLAALWFVPSALVQKSRETPSGGKVAELSRDTFSDMSVERHAEYAARLFESRDVQLPGRYLCRREFMSLLKRPLPADLRRNSESMLKALEAETDSIYRQYWSLGDIAFRQGNSRVSAEYFRKITLLIPDPGDQRYLRAQEALRKLRTGESGG